MYHCFRKIIKSLLPGSVLKLKNIHSQQWLTAVHEQLISSVQSMTIIEAKIKFLSKNKRFHSMNDVFFCYLDLIQTWPLFGTTLFPVEVCHMSF
jgi:hypothetical protein